MSCAMASPTLRRPELAQMPRIRLDARRSRATLVAGAERVTLRRGKVQGSSSHSLTPARASSRLLIKRDCDVFALRETQRRARPFSRHGDCSGGRPP